jgi:uncharacterized membrane protein YhaH (DUF805 family)
MSGKKFRCKGCEAILVATGAGDSSAPRAAAAPGPLETRSKAATPRKKAAARKPQPEAIAPVRKKRRAKKPVEAFDDGYGNDPFGALDDLGDDYGEDYGDDENPYAAPRSKGQGKKKKKRGGSSRQLTSIQKLFSFEGRLNRRDYWTYSIATNIITIGAAFAIGFAGEAIGDQAGAIFTIVALIPLVIFALWIALAIIVKRLHDRDKGGGYVVLAFVPLANLWIAIECAFFAGTPGRNDYGSEPE